MKQKITEIKGDKMKLKNENLLHIYRCLQEILNCQKAKEEIPESGDMIFKLMMFYNKIDPMIKSVAKKESQIRESAKSAFSDKDERAQAISIQLELLFNEETDDIKLHQITLDQFKILQKYLSGPSTIALFEFFIKESKLN